jgi:hypothetical protein
MRLPQLSNRKAFNLNQELSRLEKKYGIDPRLFLEVRKLGTDNAKLTNEHIDLRKELVNSATLIRAHLRTVDRLLRYIPPR